MRKLLMFLLILNMSTCHKEEIRWGDKETPPSSVIDEYTSIILALQTTLGALSDKIADMADGDSRLLILLGQLNTVTKIFQTEIYGDDCIDDVEVGCPKAGSALERLTTAEGDITSVQADILSIQTLTNNFQTRLDNFNGTGSSLETIVSGNQADIAAVQSRLNNFDGSGNTIEVEFSDVKNRLDIIEAAIAGNKKWYLFCGDIFLGGSDLHEPFFTNSTEDKLWAYGVSGSSNGLALISEAGVTGHLSVTSTASTKKCNVRIYDNTTNLKVCWDNTDRLASDATIDTECDLAGGFASQTANCTCRP